jgi:hypothetical protein
MNSAVGVFSANRDANHYFGRFFTALYAGRGV